MSAAELRHLASIGLTADQIAGVAEMLDAREAARPTEDRSKAAIRMTRYRSRLQITSSAWVKLRAEVLERDGHKCRYCGSTGNGRGLHCDHVLPLSKGGTNHPSNLVAACQFCNCGKSGKTLEEWRPNA